MCGIAGLVSLGAERPSAAAILGMCAAIRHRGPDDTGYGLYGQTALGNTRLKIIDLSAAGNQPVSNERRNIHVVQNGEIYNFQDLRNELTRAGHQFRSQTDTEVLVHLYEEMGPSFVEKLDGMFAIALWDETKLRLVLARDRAGKRPLFYYHDNNILAFGSEIKALLAHPLVPAEVASEYLPAYLSFGYVPCPYTFYRGIRQIEPGHVAVLEAGRFRLEAFWQLRMDPREIGFEDACAEIRTLVTRAVKKRLISDVPLGVLLSGGLDSSIVVAAASKEISGLKTFSAVFPDEPAFNEAGYARIVATHFGTDHHELEVRPQAADLFEKLVFHHDQPYMDSSAVPTYLISRLAREHVTVALNGDGGDELFAGYKRFWAVLQLQKWPSWMFRVAGSLAPVLARSNHARLRQRLLRWTDTADLPMRDRYPTYASFFLRHLDGLVRPEIRQNALDPLFSFHAHEAAVAGAPPLARLLYLNYREYLLNDLNVKMDRCSMANSMETRSPFLDVPLTEFVAGLPDDFKLRGKTRKYILRAAFKEVLPVEILQRGKLGFAVPLERWFKGDLKDMVRDTLLSPSARVYDYLEPKAVERFVNEQFTSGEDWSNHLWLLLTLETWLRSHRALFGRPLAATPGPVDAALQPAIQ